MTSDAIKALKNAPSDNLLCHYTKADTAPLILKHRTVRLSRITWTNDPWETRVQRFEGTDFNGPIPKDCDHPSSTFDRLFHDRVRVLCGTRDCYSNASHIVERGFGRPRMWAQYGRGRGSSQCGQHREGKPHAGACLIFERNELEKQLRHEARTLGSVFCDEVCYEPGLFEAALTGFAVDYDEFKLLGSEALWKKQIDRFSGALFFRKHQDWHSENEWRCVLVDDGHASDAVDFDFRDTLKYVVLGCAIEDRDVEAIAALAKVPTLRLRVAEADFILNYL